MVESWIIPSLRSGICCRKVLCCCHQVVIWIDWMVPDALRRIQGSGVFLWIWGYKFLEIWFWIVDDYGFEPFGMMILELWILIPSTSEQPTHLCQSLCAINFLRSPSVESSVANQNVYRDYLAELMLWVGVLIDCWPREQKERRQRIVYWAIYDADYPDVLQDWFYRVLEILN